MQYAVPPVAGRAVMSVAQMGAADRYAMAHGMSGPVLMANAGFAVAVALARRWSKRPVAVLCGPGNNGGDGWVAARVLAGWGWPVRLYSMVGRDKLKGDAAHHAALWHGAVRGLGDVTLTADNAVIDALFGAGLDRPLEGQAAAVLHRVVRSGCAVLAVDVPSGLHGDTGAVLGTAVAADLTVTFHRPKPAHVLRPGRALCGDVAVVDIGIPQDAQVHGSAVAWQADPAVMLPPLLAGDHKYDRGHLLVLGGWPMAGAARLATAAARRTGLGMATLCGPSEGLTHDEPGAVLHPLADDALPPSIRKVSAVLFGPGAGRHEAARQRLWHVLYRYDRGVLDADALMLMAEDPAQAFVQLAKGDWVLTPHAGEAARLFPDLAETPLLARARAVADRAGCVVVLKGPDTVIGVPGGVPVIAPPGPPALASAGTGDVLAGIIAGLLARGLNPVEAATTGARLHSQAAAVAGSPLRPEDLLDPLTDVVREASP